MNRNQMGSLIGGAITLLIAWVVLIYRIGYHKGILKSNERLSKELSKIIDNVSVKKFDEVIKWEEV